MIDAIIMIAEKHKTIPQPSVSELKCDHSPMTNDVKNIAVLAPSKNSIVILYRQH